MRWLLLQPEDDPLNEGWSYQEWDGVLDLGIAGPATYAKWRESLGCEVRSACTLDREEFAKLRRLFETGRDLLVDCHGLDWWDIISIRWLENLEQVLLVTKALRACSPDDEIFVSTSGCFTGLIAAMAPGRVRFLQTADPPKRHWVERMRNLTARQMIEILGDKYDGDYRYRRLVAPPPARAPRPVILIPSAYGNASRVAISYAAALAEVEFLLIATRNSGWPAFTTPNVKVVRLASYAAPSRNEEEFQALLSSWKKLQVVFQNEPELAALHWSGSFQTVPRWLREGLAVRDCWANVFKTEPIASVLCPDEKNPNTRIPVLLARNRSTPTVSCHHGAMDGRYLYLPVCSERILAKSEMEWDYLVNVCKIPARGVFVAAPKVPPASHERTRNAIVFFSEPYELMNCRARQAYAEILPGLAAIAKSCGCELVVKLHPFESLRGRKSLVRDALSSSDTRVLAGPLTEDLLQQTWFSVTVSSTAALDCFAREIPSFVCTWLDNYGYRYAEQFVKFGVAAKLDSADQIPDIPMLLQQFRPVRPYELSRAMDPLALRELLLSGADSPDSKHIVAGERLWA